MLTDHGSEVWYRNFEFHPLLKAAPSSSSSPKRGRSMNPEVGRRPVSQEPTDLEQLGVYESKLSARSISNLSVSLTSRSRRRSAAHFGSRFDGG